MSELVSSLASSPTYQPATVEPWVQAFWRECGVYRFSPRAGQQVYSIDTPPATVSGDLHLGQVCSYSHTDFIARFRRMRGEAVFYPMGFDDNGLPTERLIEQQLGAAAAEIGHDAFVRECLLRSAAIEQEYTALWRRLGLSVDWQHTYRTIDDRSRKTSQRSFLDLYRQGLVYRREAPAIWCPECRTTIAQAELNDLERPTEFFTLPFGLDNGETLPIATTRPELLPACVAVFVHPEDERFRALIGHQVTRPLFGRQVPLLADRSADPTKGTGAVMCCTFGDTTDVEWQRTHELPLIGLIGRDGRLTATAGNDLVGLTPVEARRRIVAELDRRGLLRDRRSAAQTVRVHERCDTPVEYVVTPQWFVRLLDFQQQLLDAGDRVAWHPPSMQARYRDWVENLRWDWCLSRQRHFGIPFPLWHCDACGQVLLAEERQLPIDPRTQPPEPPCACGGTSLVPETDVMDTWATSALTPQIAGRQLDDAELYRQVFPFSLRPQAHEIIRTWTFYTIAKHHYHWGVVPWQDIAISGWVLAPDGKGKISKSRGGAATTPAQLLDRYGTDAVRYWAAGASLGRDVLFGEDRIRSGARLVTKLWNVARFSRRFLEGYRPPVQSPALAPADRWLLTHLQRLIAGATERFQGYDYAGARSETERFFWHALADNYLELAKLRLYDDTAEQHAGARYALHRAVLDVIRLFAPVLPHVTEAIYQGLFAGATGSASLHSAAWPVADPAIIDEEAEAAGDELVAIAATVRRYKSEQSLPLRTELPLLQLATDDPALAATLRAARQDLRSVTRARELSVIDQLDVRLIRLKAEGRVAVGIST